MNLLLQVHAGGPLPDYNAQLHIDSAKQVESAQTEAQAKVNFTQPSRLNQTGGGGDGGVGVGCPESLCSHSTDTSLY